MINDFSKKLGIILSSLPAAGLACGIAVAHAGPLPVPQLGGQLKPSPAPFEKIVVAGGCFWGIQAVFQHVNGVEKAISGYAGGTAETANYKAVSNGSTAHAEAVEITYDPSKVTLGTLLRVFFSVAHDPTTLNRQGPDRGTQYRSAIFVIDDEQKRIVDAYIQQLSDAKTFPNPIVTAVDMLPVFYPAEDYHQDYARNNPTQPYIVAHDLPKIADLKKTYPEIYTEKN